MLLIVRSFQIRSSSLRFVAMNEVVVRESGGSIESLMIGRSSENAAIYDVVPLVRAKKDAGDTLKRWCQRECRCDKYKWAHLDKCAEFWGCEQEQPELR